MAAPRLALSVFVLLLASIALSEGMRRTGPKRCCFRFTERPVASKNVEGYIRTSQQCSNSAVILKMVNGGRVCVRPTHGWVKDIIQQLDSNIKPGQQSSL